MFTFSKATPTPQPRPSLHSRTFNGWTSTIERMRSLGAPPSKPRNATLCRGNSNSPNQSVEGAKASFKRSISLPFPLNYSPFPFVVPSKSPHPAEGVETTVPLYGVGTRDYPGFQPFRCTKVLLVASTDESRPCRIRRINTRKELPWVPITKPLPPLPSSPKLEPVSDASYLSATPSHSSSTYSYPITPRNSVDGIFDDGLDDLSHFLRRIAYDVISASAIHRHLGFMEDGGRVLPLGRTMRSVRRSLSPARRYSSLMGISLAIMEGRLPKALMDKQ